MDAVLLNKTFDLYLSSNRIRSKSILWFGKYELLKTLTSKSVILSLRSGSGLCLNKTLDL